MWDAGDRASSAMRTVTRCFMIMDVLMNVAKIRISFIISGYLYLCYRAVFSVPVSSVILPPSFRANYALGIGQCGINDEDVAMLFADVRPYGNLCFQS